MHELMKTLRTDEAKARAGQVARYGELLRRGDSINADETKDLKFLISLLGLTLEQVEAHARALESRRNLTSLADSAPEHEKKMREARKAYAEYEAEAQKQIDQIKGKLRALLAESHTAEARHVNASRAANKLYELNAQNAELFGLTESELESQRPKPAMNWPKNEAPPPIPINQPMEGAPSPAPASQPPGPPRPFARK